MKHSSEQIGAEEVPQTEGARKFLNKEEEESRLSKEREEAAKKRLQKGRVSK